MKRGLVAVLLLASLMMGCSGSQSPACYPVGGQVLWGDQPLAEAMIVLHLRSERPPGVPQPIAWTDAEGHFVVTTFSPGDGAPSGDYAITIERRRLREVGDELTRDGPNELPLPYARPETSGFQVTVGRESVTIPPLRIQP